MTAEDFMDLLSAEQDNFTFEKYDLFDNNCNHFSNFCTEMLLGKSIPNSYLNQAEEFKGTPIYNMLKGFQVNANNNRNNYNISYQGFQQTNTSNTTAFFKKFNLFSPNTCSESTQLGTIYGFYSTTCKS